ncbi:hypothetical protein ROJ8625_02659 [Roseivivax jejudonensis]|uniref:Uncharacterized protein n=1 Tax=Roseivivax jejudonensis TaxID=1529041 RepID=A0A1X6ZJ36_9RHOB|nr:hypothetical protein [Roseivivax jejudonensis]SLN52667.1 hypothetical protein ROJ8625_02659 [Roseivivax jejudonensis]
MDGSTIDDQRLADAEAQRARYEVLKAEYERTMKVEVGQTMALPYAAAAYAETMEQTPLLQKASHIAQLVCIAAAGAFPILLFFHVAL